eukprot:scaffold138339_cov16-Tisochrysis_lutea.AAC.1
MEDAAQKEEAAAEQQALPIFAKAVIEQAAGVLVPHRLPSIPETFTGLLHGLTVIQKLQAKCEQGPFSVEEARAFHTCMHWCTVASDCLNKREQQKPQQNQVLIENADAHT